MKTTCSVVLFTGGMDSTATAHYAKQFMNSDVIALTLKQHDINWKEVQCAENMCNYLGIRHVVEDISGYADFTQKQVTNSCNYQEGNQSDIEKNFIYNRNAYFLLLGHSLCQRIMSERNYGQGFVMCGLIHTDPPYPDSNLNYFTGLSNVLNQGLLKGNIQILSPLFNYTKQDIYNYLIEQNIPIDLTWSCNTNHELPCGQCYGCTQLKKLTI